MREHDPNGNGSGTDGSYRGMVRGQLGKGAELGAREPGHAHCPTGSRRCPGGANRHDVPKLRSNPGGKMDTFTQDMPVPGDVSVSLSMRGLSAAEVNRTGASPGPKELEGGVEVQMEPGEGEGLPKRVSIEKELRNLTSDVLFSSDANAAPEVRVLRRRRRRNVPSGLR